MQVQQATFLQGSIFKHVITMSTTNAIGLIAIFMVDLVDIYFISLLQNSAFTAAIGYASAILFFSTAICIGLTMANSATVAKCIGQGQHAQARQYVSHLCLFSLLFTTAVAILVWFVASDLLTLLGAQGDEHVAALLYLQTIIISLPILALSMQMGATLRSLGDVKHAMYATLLAGIVNALLDPLFIFTFGMDLQGAAIASVCARLSALLLSAFYLLFRYRMLIWPTLNQFIVDIKEITNIAFPAMLTQLATPLGNLYVTYEIAKFGSNYMAGWAIIGRLIPVAFGVMFAVSGAISPIIAQNFGAHDFLRLRLILKEAVKFITGYCLVISLLLSFAQETIITIFNVQNEATEIIRLFCQHIAITFIFSGMTFIAMAFLNNLGYAKYATLLNVVKVTLGTIPFVTLGAVYYEAPGILYGQALANITFSFVALFLTMHIIKHLESCYKRQNSYKLKNNGQSSSS